MKKWIGQSCPDGVCLGHITATGKCSVCGMTVEEAKSKEKLRPKEMYFQQGVETSTEAISATKVGTANSAVKNGAWCPNCRSRDTYKTTSGVGCFFVVLILISFGLALIMIPFLPKTCHCRACGNEWRAYSKDVLVLWNC